MAAFHAETLRRTLLAAQIANIDIIAEALAASRTGRCDAPTEKEGEGKAANSRLDRRELRRGGNAGMLDAQARAYASTIQAISSKADIKVKGAQLRLDAARTKVQKFLADLYAYKAEQEFSLRQAQYSTNVYQVQIEGWKAKTSASVADAEMQSRFSDMNTRTNIAYSEMQISEFTAKMQKAVQQAQIALEAAKAHRATRRWGNVGGARIGQYQRLRFCQFFGQPEREHQYQPQPTIARAMWSRKAVIVK